MDDHGGFAIQPRSQLATSWAPTEFPIIAVTTNIPLPRFPCRQTIFRFGCLSFYSPGCDRNAKFSDGLAQSRLRFVGDLENLFGMTGPLEETLEKLEEVSSASTREGTLLLTQGLLFRVKYRWVWCDFFRHSDVQILLLRLELELLSFGGVQISRLCCMCLYTVVVL